jgi:hypothetical protein
MMDRILNHMPRICACVLGWSVTLQVDCRAEEETLSTPQQSVQQAAPEDVRYGGTIERSYNYHRQHLTSAELQPMRSQIEMGGIPQANGWYNYGFPMRSYRYGWFGAERPHHPHVMWHQGYYGDKVRTSYRYAY